MSHMICGVHSAYMHSAYTCVHSYVYECELVIAPLGLSSSPLEPPVLFSHFIGVAMQKMYHRKFGRTIFVILIKEKISG